MQSTQARTITLQSVLQITQMVSQYRAFLIYALIASLHVFSYHTYWVESKRGVECQQSELLMLCESCILSTLHYLSVVTK